MRDRELRGAAQQGVAADHQQLDSIEPGCRLAAYWVGGVGTGQRCCWPLNADPLGSAERERTMDVLKYIEKCTGTNHNGPAWIAYVQTSKSGRMIYFNGKALKRAAKGFGQGNHFDVETGEPYWISGVKKRGSNRHWAGSGHILVEESAVRELLALQGEPSLDMSLYKITSDFPRTDPQKFKVLLNEKL